MQYGLYHRWHGWWHRHWRRPGDCPAARERGILTVGVITKPFEFEGQRRMKQAEDGIEELQLMSIR